MNKANDEAKLFDKYNNHLRGESDNNIKKVDTEVKQKNSFKSKGNNDGTSSDKVDIVEEITMLHDIRDIRDELNILSTILKE